MVAASPKIRHRVHQSPLEIINSILIHLVLIFAVLITLYPFVYVLSMSISDPAEVIRGKVWLWPEGFSIKSYELLLQDKNLWISLYNTCWYAVVGTALNIVMTITFSYPLSRKDFFLRSPLMIFTAIPMFFSGGLIPLFLLIVQLGLYNTMWAIVIPAAMASWNVIITRVFFQSSIPEALADSAKIDGATDIQFLLRVVLPLSGPIIAVLVVFNFVGFWNTFFNALIFLSSSKLQPLQVLLQKILINHTVNFSVPMVQSVEKTMLGIQMRYAIIIFSVAPILVMYPFMQKYFAKGYMIGAIKE
ncbi:MAG: carbohydrate ABC transporter permease [Spirochaetales bacterium]